MRKIIFIGECAVNIAFQAHTASLSAQSGVMPNGILLNAAIASAGHDREVIYVSETARDFLGDMLVTYLSESGIDTRCIDRYSEGGATTVYITRHDTDSTCNEVIHSRMPQQKFDTVWPRIDPADIVVFGNYFSLHERTRPQVTDLISHAAERKALIIYVPGFPPQLAPRITRIMPAILENLEMAHIVFTTGRDLKQIFGNSDPETAYRNNIAFHTPVAFNFDPATGTLSISSANATDSMRLNKPADSASVLSSLIDSCCSLNLTPELIPIFPAALGGTVLKTIADKL